MFDPTVLFLVVFLPFLLGLVWLSCRPLVHSPSGRFLLAFLCVTMAGACAILASQVHASTAELAGEAPTVFPAAELVGFLSPYIQAVVSGFVLAVLSVLTPVLKQRWGLDIEARHREALHSALMTGVRDGLGVLQVKAGSTAIEVRSAVVAHAIAWARSSVPDALAKFQLDRDDEAALAKLEKLANATLTSVLVSNGTGLLAGLAPVSAAIGVAGRTGDKLVSDGLTPRAE